MLARPDGARYRFVKYLRRNRLALAVVGVVVLSLTAGLAAALWQRERAVQEAAKANAIKDYLIGLFEANDIEQRDGLKKRQQSVQQLLEGSVDGLGHGLQAQPEVRDELQRRTREAAERGRSALYGRRSTGDPASVPTEDGGGSGGSGSGGGTLLSVAVPRRASVAGESTTAAVAGARARAGEVGSQSRAPAGTGRGGSESSTWPRKATGRARSCAWNLGAAHPWKAFWKANGSWPLRTSCSAAGASPRSGPSRRTYSCAPATVTGED